jgi:hypothetical protein
VLTLGPLEQGCQMAYFQTKNPNLGKFRRAFAMKDVGIFYGHLVYFPAISVYFMVICYIFSRFGKLYQKKSGNPALEAEVSIDWFAKKYANAAITTHTILIPVEKLFSVKTKKNRRKQKKTRGTIL